MKINFFSILLSLHDVSALSLSSHAMFSTKIGREVSHRWRPDTVVLNDGVVLVDADALRQYTQAQIALERSQHTCVGTEPDLSLFIIFATTKDVHALEAVLWGKESRKSKATVLRELYSWYTQVLPGVALDAKLSEPIDQEAWIQATCDEEL